MAANLVTIRFFAAAKAVTKSAHIEVSATTLGQALDLATGQFPNLADVLPKCSYLINGQSAKAFESILKNGDVVDVLPPFAGG